MQWLDEKGDAPGLAASVEAETGGVALTLDPNGTSMLQKEIRRIFVDVLCDEWPMFNSSDMRHGACLKHFDDLNV